MSYRAEERVGLWRVIDNATNKPATYGNNRAWDQGGYRTRMEALRKIKKLMEREAKKNE